MNHAIVNSNLKCQGYWLIGLFALMSAFKLNAQSDCQKKTNPWYEYDFNRIFFDLGTFTTHVNGVALRDFDISDSRLYGLKGVDSINKESRFRVPLGNAPRDLNLCGIAFGFRTMRGPAMLNTAFHIYYAGHKSGNLNINLTQICYQVSPVIWTQSRFRLLSNFELGTILNSIKVKNMQNLQGYHDYLDDKKFVLKNGDWLKLKSSDLNLQLGMTFQYALSKKTYLFASATYNVFLSSSTITNVYSSSSKNSKITMDSSEIMTTDPRSTMHYRGQPQYKTGSWIITVGFSFYLWNDKEYRDKKANSSVNDQQQPAKPNDPPRCKCCGKVLPTK